jgi:hypothetical protein
MLCGRICKQHFGLSDAGLAGGEIFCAVDDDAEGAAFHSGFASKKTDGNARQLQGHRREGGERRVLADPTQAGGGVEEDDGFLAGVGDRSRPDLFREFQHAPVIGAAKEVFTGAVDGGFHADL